jgi:signal transduction histidine kinase
MAERGSLVPALPRAALTTIIVVGLGLIALTATAAWNARRSYGRAFPSLFIDPHASFSIVWWPAWGDDRLPINFPDRLVAIDGAPVRAPRSHFEPPARAVAEALTALHARGHSHVQLTWATRAGPTTITRPVRTLGAEETLFFFGLYALIGVFVVWSGLAVLSLAGRRAGAAAYAGWSVSSFIFLVTFFDYHSTAVLSPLFAASTVSVPLCVVWLAYSFPEPPRRPHRLLRSALIAFTAGGVVAAGLLVIGPLVDRSLDLRPLRLAVGATAFASLLVLSASILFRLRVERGRRRQELRSSALGLAVVPAVLGLGFLFSHLGDSASVHLVLPFLAPLLPLSVGYALIRHNVLETTAVLTRRMFIVPVLTSALVVAVVAWLGLRVALHDAGSIALVPWVGAGATMVILAAAGFRASSRFFFAATARFRPTLQQLADDLASKGNATDLGTAIQEAVTRWLPTERADVLSPADLDRLAHRPPKLDELMEQGTAVWTTEPHWRRRLLVPMRSQGGLRGVLMLAPKHEAALYTREDLELLETIASLGAVALHNAEVFAELQAMRRLEADVARDDKRLTLGLLGAEVSHEIAYPLNFLRYLLREGDGGTPVDARDLEAAREEIGRLERMFATLHRLKVPEPRLEPVLVLPRIRRALDLVREIVETNRINATIDVPPDLVVTAEADRLVQIFANLLRNAVQAVPPGSAVGVRSRAAAHDGSMTLEVWDEGPGIADDIASAIFNPFVSSKQGSMGLGLAVTQRLVRGFGWSIGVSRQDGRTVFGIEIPPARADRSYYGSGS